MSVCPKCVEDSPCWRKRPYTLYTEYCYPHELKEASPKLFSLIEEYGVMFDDYWKYRVAGRTRKVIVHEPLWLGMIESGQYAEPVNHTKDIFQTRLLVEEDKTK